MMKGHERLLESFGSLRGGAKPPAVEAIIEEAAVPGIEEGGAGLSLEDVLGKFVEGNKTNIFAPLLADLFRKEKADATAEDFMGFLQGLNAITSDERLKEYSSLTEMTQQGLGTGEETQEEKEDVKKDT